MWFKKTYQIKVNRTADLKAQQNNFEYCCLKLQFFFLISFTLQSFLRFIGTILEGN